MFFLFLCACETYRKRAHDVWGRLNRLLVWWADVKFQTPHRSERRNRIRIKSFLMPASIPISLDDFKLVIEQKRGQPIKSGEPLVQFIHNPHHPILMAPVVNSGVFCKETRKIPNTELQDSSMDHIDSEYPIINFTVYCELRVTVECGGEDFQSSKWPKMNLWLPIYIVVV